MKVLFVARRFPPSIGGMERFAYDLSEALPTTGVELVKVTWGGSSRLTLIFAIPWLFLRSVWALLSDKSIDIIHMQDAVLSPPGWLLAKLFGRPWLVVAHGLDLTFNLAFYQKVNVWFAARADAMTAISTATADQALKRGVDKSRLTPIPLGVHPLPLKKVDRDKVRSVLGLKDSDQVVLTVGRLAKRKGVAWFIDQVLPELPSNVHYVVIGDGAERGSIEQAIARRRLGDRVHLLGKLDDSAKEDWLRSADLFVMPNIRVPGDMEGFGIVAHEAALAELPVVASQLEGVADALQDGQNGRLVEPGDKQAYRAAITKFLKDPKASRQFGQRARRYTIKTFSWPAIAARYKKVYDRITIGETEAS